MAVKTDERPGNTFGEYLKRVRGSSDMTQMDVADRSSGTFNQKWLAAVEQGHIQNPPPDKFNVLQRILRFPAWEGLRRMGFAVESPDVGYVINSTLLLEVSQLTDTQQKQALEQVRLLRRFS